ncbi:ChrR-like anti-ECFsigma factor [Rhodothalassium salexigens DSM 2132]|uniref:ChrR-like anti-ECFsigma factor n=1 Tax=Rhodothalassium salexigens DSM 2132 TaxID=1188247 RepID=A0A4R2PPM1_RHOSA|nr:ChrR family anti-sigma-E factor [Rhodothalassium salexigens]MBB4211214.1 putative transcriptional regulator [Rhodothalassium salexigens DSM 2132]MBK1637553.1 hypothetical protein [Rhodothalassium salexigens DSM 2132]TCP36131.1 ChrR-like anti-ECFsigma factor [Rhodothalassium salexigens DSM 2132]
MQTQIDDALMLDYVSGSLAEPVALAVATHLSLSDRARSAYTETMTLGGGLLCALDDESLSDDALDDVLARLDDEDFGDETAGAEMPGMDAGGLDDAALALVPEPLRPYIKGSLDGLDWKRRGNGVTEARIDLPGSDVFRVSLLKVDPGRAMPQHSHRGREYTVVLQGGYRDGDIDLDAGDFCEADGGDIHQPVADAKEGCLCLIVLDAPVRLTGALGWVVNPFLKT